jgi:hypothetical protein
MTLLGFIKIIWFIKISFLVSIRYSVFFTVCQEFCFCSWSSSCLILSIERSVPFQRGLIQLNLVVRLLLTGQVELRFT